MAEATLEIINRLGLHARAAAKIVSIASRHDAEIRLGDDEKMIDARSIMGILTLGASKGSSVRVEVSGPEAQQALRELCELFERGFDEEE